MDSPMRQERLRKLPLDEQLEIKELQFKPGKSDSRAYMQIIKV
jgi:hypothetical protein